MAARSIQKFMPPRKRRRANTPSSVEPDSVFFPANQAGYGITASAKLATGLKVHLHRLCRDAKVKHRGYFVNIVSAVAGRHITSNVDAWEWLLDSWVAATGSGEWQFRGKENAILAMRRGFKRVRQEIEDARIAAERRKAMLEAQKIPGAEFYQSKAWRELRYQVLVKRGARCEVCGRTAKDGIVIHVDHILPRSQFPDLALEETNLQVFCEDCNIGKGTEDTTDWRGDKQGEAA